MSLSGISGSLAGQLLNCPGQAQAVQVVVAGTTYLADFNGNWKVLLDPNRLSQFLSGATNLVYLLLQEYVFHGIGTGVGIIEMIMDPNRVPPQSTITAIVSGRPFPAIQDMVVNMNVTIPNLLPRITMQNKIPSNPGPTIFRNSNVTNFPPQNDVYALVEPIELEDVNNPGPVLATIQSFPLTVNAAS